MAYRGNENSLFAKIENIFEYFMTKKNNYLIAVYCLFFVTLTPFSTSSFSADEKKPSPKPALTVTLAQPLASDLPQRLSANGNIAAWQEASIGAEAQGLRLRELRADVGDRVRAGQLLAVFASDGIEADLAQARAALAEAEVAALAASQDADRARSVQNSGAISAQQISQLLSAELAAKARVETAKAQIATHQVRLRHTRVLAPDNGIISSRTASIGAVGAGASGELFRLIRKGRLEWRAEVTASELGRVKPGLLVIITTTAGATVKGKVRLIAPQVDAQTRTALVYVDLPTGSGANELVRPGMFAKGDFELGSTAGVTLPQSAVIMRDGFAYLYVVGADSRVAQQKVQTGRTVGDRVEILGKLAPDARVVAVGAGFLNDGDLVRVNGAK